MTEIKVKGLIWGHDYVRKMRFGSSPNPYMRGYRVRGNKWCRIGLEGTQFICDSEDEAIEHCEQDHREMVLRCLEGQDD